MKYLTIAGLCVLIISCKEQITDKYSNYKVEGVDRHGNNRVCFNDPDTVCAGIADLDEEEFAQSCQDSGHKVHPCGCEEYICEQKTFTGLDINGQKRTCKEIAPDIACTMVFTENDQFALDCENDGAMAVQCGCHDYICVSNSNFSSNLQDDDSNEKSPDSINEFFGTNQEGIATSCIPEKDIVCPTVINHLQVYALNCKEEGYDVAWCNCNEVLCLDQ